MYQNQFQIYININPMRHRNVTPLPLPPYMLLLLYILNPHMLQTQEYIAIIITLCHLCLLKKLRKKKKRKYICIAFVIVIYHFWSPWLDLLFGIISLFQHFASNHLLCIVIVKHITFLYVISPTTQFIIHILFYTIALQIRKETCIYTAIFIITLLPLYMFLFLFSCSISCESTSNEFFQVLLIWQCLYFTIISEDIFAGHDSWLRTLLFLLIKSAFNLIQVPLI